LAVYNNEFILGSACVAQKVTETTKSLKTCYIFNISHVHFKIVRRRTKNDAITASKQLWIARHWTCGWSVASMFTHSC